MIDLMFLTDGYKLDHRRQYPSGTEYVYSNFTPRKSRNAYDSGIINFGIQKMLCSFTDKCAQFFTTPKHVILSEYSKFLDSYFGPNSIGVVHIAALHDLGYMPLEFRALPEGTFVPYGVPILTVENTHPDFFWLPNYFETFISSSLWLPITSATTARKYRKILNYWANLTSSVPEFVDWQGHDFSFRGMSSIESAITSGMAHLLFFNGTDTVPAIRELENIYRAEGLIGGSVPATEHSVMCAGGAETEQQTFERLMELYPSGILSVVSDTWNLWDVITKILPSLKDQILARDGKLVIRPDSGDPADILCGDPNADPNTPQGKGVITLLWDLFGGFTNAKGYKELNSHIGTIYGDSITTDRAEEICRRLAEKEFASTNVVLGIGSFTYQYATRDSHGFAMKATAATINGKEIALFKDPITDDGTKKSAKGRLAVQEVNGKLTLIQNLSKEEWLNTPSLLNLVYKDGGFASFSDFQTIKDRAQQSC